MGASSSAEIEILFFFVVRADGARPKNVIEQARRIRITGLFPHCVEALMDSIFHPSKKFYDILRTFKKVS